MCISDPRIEYGDDHTCIRESTARIGHRLRIVDISIQSACQIIYYLSLIIESPEVRKVTIIWERSPRKSTEVV